MSAPLRCILLLITVACTAFSTSLCSPPTASAQQDTTPQDALQPISENSLIPVPVPKLDNLEEAVRNQLREEQSRVDNLIQTRGASRPQCAQAYMELGEMYHAYKLTDAAQACYRNALILDPSRAEWNYNLGYLLQSIGRYAEAVEFYQEALASQPDSYLIPIRSGECYRSLNQLKEAAEAFQAAFRVNPDGPAILARLGEVALEEKRYQDAAKFLAAALQKQPAANKLHYQLAMAYRSMGDLDKARHHLSQRGVVGVQPPDPLQERLNDLITGHRVHTLSGRRAYSAGRYAEATEEFRKAVEAAPENAGARVNLGTALAQQLKYQEALVQYREAVRLAPENMTAQFDLGSLLSHLGELTAAEEHLKIVVEKQPKDHQAHLALADTLRDGRRFGEAFAHYRTATKLDPGQPRGWLEMSTLLSLADQHSEALQVLEEAHQRIPGSIPVNHALARQLAASPLLNLRNGSQALQLASKVYEEQISYEHARTVAMAYAEVNRCEEAGTWQQRAIDIARESQVAEPLIELLNRNLMHYKNQRPCRVPGN